MLKELFPLVLFDWWEAVMPDSTLSDGNETCVRKKSGRERIERDYSVFHNKNK